MITSEYYGLKEYSKIYGMVYIALSTSGTGGPFYAGFFFDFTQSYQLCFLSIIAIMLLSAILILSALLPRGSRK